MDLGFLIIARIYLCLRVLNNNLLGARLLPIFRRGNQRSMFVAKSAGSLHETQIPGSETPTPSGHLGQE